MADIATLAIKIENGDVAKATTSLNSLEVAGGKAEASTQRLTRRMALLEIQAREMDAEIGRGGRAMAAMEAEARKLDAELERERRAMALLEIEARKMDAAMQKGRLSMAGIAESIGLSTTAAAKLGAAFGAISVGLLVRDFARLSDEYTNLRARLSLVTTDTANLNAVQAALFDVSQRTRTALASTDGLYVSLARSTKALGLSQQDLVGITQTVTQAFKLSGASTAEADNAIRQLGQAFASGVLRGDEFNSMAENAPRLQQALADSLGVSIGQLRKMAEDGKLTSDVLAKAFMGASKSIGDEFAKLPPTIGGAMQQISNELLKAIGGMNDTSGAANGLVLALQGIAGQIGPTFGKLNEFIRSSLIEWAHLSAAAQKAHEIMSLPIGPGFFAKAKAIAERIEFDLSAKLAEINARGNPAAGTVGTTGGGNKPPPIVDPNAKKDLDALQKATDAYYNSLNQHQIDAAKTIGTTREQNAALRDLIAATMEGPAAVDALTVAQAGANAVRELGAGVSDRLAASVRQEAEEHARLAIQLGRVKDAQTQATAAEKKAIEEHDRDIERRARHLQRATANAIEQGITDVVNGKNPLVALADGFKRAMIHAISEALAQRFLASKFAGMLGIGVDGAAKKQDVAANKMVVAGKEMNEAADKFLRANGITIDGSTSDGGVASSAGNTAKMAQMAKAAAVAVASAYAGYQTGQATSSTSHSTAGNYIRGAIGGAVSGAIAGAQIAGPPGAVVGAVIGLVAGVFGANKAMKEAAKAAEEMRKALSMTMDAVRAEVGKDALSASIAQVNAQRETIRKQIEDAYSGGDKNSDTVRERNRQLAELNALENERIRQLREEAAIISQRRIEDYQQRLDDATPGNERAEAIAAFNRKQDRELEDLQRELEAGGWTDAEKATYAIAQQAIEAEKLKFATEQNTKALHDLTTAVRFAPSGFKLAGYIQDHATASPMPTPKWAVPTNPFVPPQSPLSPPMLSQSATSATSSPITFHITINESDTPELTADVLTRMVVGKIDESRSGMGGVTNMTRAAALERMKGSPVLRP